MAWTKRLGRLKLTSDNRKCYYSDKQGRIVKDFQKLKANKGTEKSTAALAEDS